MALTDSERELLRTVRYFGPFLRHPGRGLGPELTLVQQRGTAITGGAKGSPEMDGAVSAAIVDLVELCGVSAEEWGQLSPDAKQFLLVESLGG